MKQPGFFDVKEHLARLRRLGDQLEAFTGLWILKCFALIWRKLWSIQTEARMNDRSNTAI